ncbi:chemotaxis protein CheB [Zobellia nedashkovskayae]|uniref:chemotaxis protein CheB n=1 Tax=Zobellia nedashkovskayae TaxID=2779510 RepID=UPI00188C0A36|nr:chemotaxis protein CheB [Zobellia nedashkovskayae]
MSNTKIIGQIENNNELDGDDHRVIAIGASAGGLEALKEFFNYVPHDCHHSFVIIQHLSPDYKSLMAELLAKNTVLPIQEVKNNMVIERGSVYLIPPKKNMTVLNGKLHLVNKPKGHDLNLPIDIFFRSLAQEYKEKSICVVLSGTGSDGTSGAREIKEFGGMVMVQDPEQAKFDGMPRSAISTGLVDYTLNVESMAGELLHYIEHPTTNGNSVVQIEEDEDTILSILKVLRKETTLDFEQYKRPTLVRRIARRISVNKLHNQREYLEFIRDNRIESDILAREFLIGVTNFFRDTYVWEKLESKIIPEMVAAKNDNDVFKVWCVGSSTGEEAYSMAMLISEEVKRQEKKLQIKIFATDLARNHIDIGSRGVYPESIIANVSPLRLRKFFIQRGEEYQVTDSLRKMVIFSHHNVLKDPPFNKMDFAVCRNMLIYMNQAAQRKVMGLLHYSLNLNGILLLGSSESLGDYSSVLKEVDRKSKIYQNFKKAKARGLEPLNYPDQQKLTASFNNLSSNKSRTETKMADVMNETVAEELGLAGVYIDETYNILHAIGEFRKFVDLPERGFSINLLKMLPPSISISLAATVRKAFGNNQRILHKTMSTKDKGNSISFDLLVNPFEMNNINRSKGCLLLFIPRKEQKGTAKLVSDTTGATGVRILELEGELKEARENLNNVVEEVETSNEELQATNEELLAANEELQSTNEELQSVNEELHTVNAELQQKIEDLASLNSDMDNLLKSTDIGTIFLDTDIRIRKFTPSVSEHFHLRDSDIGRPISHFANSFGTGSSTLDRVQEVIDSGKMLSRELQAADGKWFLKRITPYFDNENLISGAVISFVDIDDIKKSEAIIRKSELEFKTLYNSAPDMFASFDPQGNLLNCNKRMAQSLGYEDPSELLGLTISNFYAEEDTVIASKRYKDYKKKGLLRNEPRKIKRKDGKIISISANAQLLYDENGQELYSICSFRDVSDLEIAEKKYQDKNQAFEQLLEGTMAGFWDAKLKEGTEYLSPSYKAMFGYKNHEIDNNTKSWEKLIHADDLPFVQDLFEKHKASKGDLPFIYQARFNHKDGSIVWVHCNAKIIEWDERGEPIRIVGSHVDITPLKTIELELYRSNKELEQFAYVASHDLQEPLNTITDFVSLLEEEYKDKLDSDAKSYIEFIIEASARMRSLVKSVLSYSKIGKNPEKTLIDCESILNDIKMDLKKSIVDTKAKIIYKNLPKIEGYSTELHSLFFNLISNAIKFRRESHSPKIDIAVEELDTHWKFSIKDNGIGIEKKNRERVFNIFQRLNNMDSYAGTGIGLAQCKKIAELHNGEIWIEENSKIGTQFNFTLKK